MSNEDPERRRDREQRKRDENRARGLTARGKPRKERHKPTPKQKTFVINKEKKPKGKDFTSTRGAAIRGTPLAMDLEKAVAKRVKQMKDEGEEAA